MVRGSHQKAAKFSEEVAAQIVSELREGVLPKELSKRHGISRRTIYNIAHGKLWKHVTNPGNGRVVDLSVNQSRGSKVQCAKLNEDLVLRIKRKLASGQSRRTLASEFGVARSSINRIAWGKAWKHVVIPENMAFLDAALPEGGRDA